AVVREDGTVLAKNQFPSAVALRTGAASTKLVLGVQDPVGGCRWLTASSQPLRRGKTREPWAAVCTMRDVTDQREIDRMKSEFVSVVSHEMRTPLTSIKGALGLVAGGAAGEISEAAQKLMDVAV